MSKKKSRKSNPNRHAVRKADGKFISADSKQTRIERWSQPGIRGFAEFVHDTKPKILHADGTYRIFRPERWQVDVLKAILHVDDQGNPQHNFCLLCWPKRHSKSVLHCILVLHAFFTRKNWLAVCLANKLEQTLSVNFRLLQDTIRNTPALLSLTGERSILSNEIKYLKHNNRIITMANRVSGAHGMKVSCLWVTELWQNEDLRTYRALFASLADTARSICYCDTNTDFRGGIIEQLEDAAKSDPSMFAHRIEYKDFRDFDARAPDWISRAAVRVSRKIDLEQDFARNWLNKRSSSKSALFPIKYIKQAKEKYKIPVEDIQSIVNGRKYIVTGGLDRAKNLLPGVSKSDYTVWTCLLKTSDPAGNEPIYYILNQVRFQINTDRNIKKVILADNKKYGFTNVCLEHYEVTGISGFLSEQGIKHELISPHDTIQNSAFPEMHRIFKDQRFKFPATLNVFENELSTFTVTQKKGGSYSFGHAGSHHDDTVYATCWAIYAGRKHILNVFELGNVQCVNKSPKRSLCYLLNGNLELLCSEKCLAAQEVKQMYRQFLEFQTESELTLPEFYRAYCRRTGALIQQAA